jgi:HPt (histidine-containing phosphotransfer) domain-containing protein
MILDDFLADIPLNILAMKAFQESGDLSGVERQAHTIKGVSANVGAERLQSVAFEMEKAAIAQDMTAAGAFMNELERQFDHFKEVMQDDVITPAQSQLKDQGMAEKGQFPPCSLAK